MRKVIGIAIMLVLVSAVVDGAYGFGKTGSKFPQTILIATGDYQGVGCKVYATHDSEDEVRYYTWLVGDRKRTAIVQTVNPKGWGTLTVYGEGSFWDPSLIERLVCEGDMGKLVEVYTPSQKEKYGRVLWNYKSELPVEGIKYELFWITINYELYREKPSKPIEKNQEQDKSYSSDWLAVGSAVTVVATEGLNVRKGPGTDYGVITQVVYKQKLKKLDYKNDWYKVETEDGDIGWVCGGEDGEIYIVDNTSGGLHSETPVQRRSRTDPAEIILRHGM